MSPSTYPTDAHDFEKIICSHWENPDEYPRLDADVGTWIFEFMRRSPEYQYDHAVINREANLWRNSRDENCKKFTGLLARMMDKWRMDPDFTKMDISAILELINPFTAFTQRKDAMRFIITPPVVVMDTDDYAGPHVTEYYLNMLRTISNPHISQNHVAILVDMRFWRRSSKSILNDIKEQLDARIEEFQKSVSTIRVKDSKDNLMKKELFRIYLRIYDAQFFVSQIGPAVSKINEVENIWKPSNTSFYPKQAPRAIEQVKKYINNPYLACSRRDIKTSSTMTEMKFF
ncbi:MAG: hypothetical protein HQL31_03055 [Planctomycetes bacterium]|nr:hypothetical protein [Planctomycetota bacterium]